MRSVTTRDYNQETQDIEKNLYTYGFDIDVMHKYMVRSFQPFFKRGNILELGSFEGNFTNRLREFFSDEAITCVEASNEAIAKAKDKVPGLNIINSTFETVDLPNLYGNIILTHVLEHVDSPVDVLRRINDEWLRCDGRLFLVCPNGNAPSRQIAVKMGLIDHNTAVTPSEAAQGHQRTYTLDTMERDARLAGLKVIHRSGIFFKALSNFQWDKILQQEIVSSEWLDACYELGQQYPDLCASIFLVCERGPE